MIRFFMLRTVAFHGIIRCVAHLYGRKNSRLSTEDLTAQVCDATGDDSSKIVGATKIWLYKNSPEIAALKRGIFMF